MDNKGIYIPSIDAKDIYLSAHYIEENPEGYNLKLKDGQYNLRKFINSLDYSLDLIELMDIYYKKYRRNDFYFKVKKHKYTVNVINLTFKYSVKELNQKKGITIILITHYMEEVVDADYVYVMDHGEVVMKGTPREIFSQVGTLKEHHLDVPQMTLLADLLRQSGLDIPLGVLTREELVDAIMKIAG